jgi:hypothetical protein
VTIASVWESDHRFCSKCIRNRDLCCCHDSLLSCPTYIARMGRDDISNWLYEPPLLSWLPLVSTKFLYLKFDSANILNIAMPFTNEQLWSSFVTRAQLPFPKAVTSGSARVKEVLCGIAPTRRINWYWKRSRQFLDLASYAVIVHTLALLCHALRTRLHTRTYTIGAGLLSGTACHHTATCPASLPDTASNPNGGSRQV